LAIYKGYFFYLMTDATSFTGSAKVESPKDCVKTREELGMDLAGMVAMGEYTNGCI